MSPAVLTVLVLILDAVASICRPDDPCANHTILDQPWRSTSCSQTVCTNGQWMGDGSLTEGWYRFHSSGGCQMPETVYPEDRCSGVIPGWLNGRHPNVTEGEVTRTVCFTWNGDTCYWSREVKLKNCYDYFVYQLKPTPCSSAVYCTDTETATMEQGTLSSTEGSTQESPTVPTEETSSASICRPDDPCANHTILDQPWRSTSCSQTVCTSGQWMGDGSLTEGWYRFHSSGGCKMPETVYPEDRCSGVIPGWLNGRHPNVTEGEVTRTVCFTWSGDTCYWSREVKLKNCYDYFVYQLKPTPCSSAVYCTAAGSARIDPCVTHTVLDQPWRSTNCSHTECTRGQWMGDGKLELEWYRFNSSGGWMIPETVLPWERCSGVFPGWLNGSHPSVEEEEVTRTVCFTWGECSCYWRREIKVKNCCDYFVYQLNPTPGSSAVYCTDPETARKEPEKRTSTERSTQETSTVPNEEPSLDPDTPTRERENLTSAEGSTLEPSTVPNEEPSSEEEHKWIELLVASSGDMTDEEVREATRNKLREMFGDPDPQIELVPCLSVIPEE